MRGFELMQNFLQKVMIFMQGRYGSDQLNISILVVVLVLNLVNVFVFNFIASLVISLIGYALIGFAVFRMLSRNIERRRAENTAFLPVYNAVTGWFKLTVKKFRERKEYRYVKCPVCKAQLRVRNVKGKHTVRCPRCSNEFKKKI